MSTLVQVPAQVINMNPRADRSWKLQFETMRELTGEEVKVLADNFQGEGWLLFKPNSDIVPDEVPQDRAETGGKSQSQRLRAVIFLLWKQRGEEGDFELFYRSHLEKLIDYIKTMLEEEDA